jgi:hypothetical protein
MACIAWRLAELLAKDPVAWTLPGKELADGQFRVAIGSGDRRGGGAGFGPRDAGGRGRE